MASGLCYDSNQYVFCIYLRSKIIYDNNGIAIHICILILRLTTYFLRS